ncbi:MAG: hypothetical protein ACFFB3_24450 [Candidatus Hodarchaeota archaeon]
MNDQQIDAYIEGHIKVLGLELADFTTGRVDMYRIVTEGEYNDLQPFDNLSIPIKDLVRYWWNNIADQEAFLDDILTEYKDRFLARKEPEENYPDFSDAFDNVAEGL